MASRIVWPAECRVSEYLAVGLPIEDIRRGTGSGCGRIEAMLVGERVKAKKKAVERAGKSWRWVQVFSVLRYIQLTFPIFCGSVGVYE